MSLKFNKKTSILLFLSLMFSLFPTTTFAQDGTQTYTTADGLTFDFPSEWTAQSIANQVFISSSPDAISGDDMQAGEVFAIVISGENMGQLFGDFDDLESAAEAISGSFETGVGTFDVEALTINGHSAIRYTFSDETSDGLMILIDMDGKFVGFIAAMPLGELEEREATLVAIAESFRYEGLEPTVGGIPALDVPAAGEGVVVWEQQFEVSENIFSEFGELLYLSTVGDNIYVTDGFNIGQFDGDGNIVEFHASQDFMILTGIAAQSDGSIWAGAFGDDVLVHFGVDGATLGGWGNDDYETPIFGDFVAIYDLVIGPDGNVYIFSPHYDDDFNAEGKVLVMSQEGELLREFTVSDEDEFEVTRFGYDAHLSFTPEGNLLVVDSGVNIKVVDTEGNVVKDDFASGSDQNIFSVNDAVAGLDGSIYLATLEGIVHLDADGVVIETYGTIQELTDEEPPALASGEFSSSGPTALALLSDGDIIVLDSNTSYNLIVRLDFSAGE